MNDNFKNKPLQTQNFTNSFQNFCISKNGSYSNSNCELANDESKLNFFQKGDENSENIPHNYPEVYNNSQNSISNLKQFKNKNTKSTSAEIMQSSYKEVNLPLSTIHEKQIPFDFIFEIWTELRASEMLFPCIPKFNHIVNKQLEISFETRAILLNWLIEVQIHFKCSNESLFLCFSIIDAYLSSKEINKQKLQLMGITAFSIACKYEEIYPPLLNDLVKITDNTFTAFEILQMESEILILLQFQLTFPTCFSFWQMISFQFKFTAIEFNYGCFLMEIYALHPNFNKYLPSLIALAIAYIILKSKKYERYRDLYQLINNEYIDRDLKICAKEIYDLISTFDQLSFKAVYGKYSSENYNYVAIKGLKGF